MAVCVFLVNTAFKDFSCIKHYALQNVIKLLAGGYKEMSSILADHAVAPSYMSPNGEGGVAGSQPMITAVHRSPNNLSEKFLSRDTIPLSIRVNIAKP
jgi:hypothetical protein